MGEAEGDLSFKKDDILYVDESLPKGSFGTWMAWQLDENAQQIQRGQIPSKYMWVDSVAHTEAHTFVSLWTVTAASVTTVQAELQKEKGIIWSVTSLLC